MPSLSLSKSLLTIGKYTCFVNVINCFIVVKMHSFMPDTCMAAEQYQCILVRDKSQFITESSDFTKQAVNRCTNTPFHLKLRNVWKQLCKNKYQTCFLQYLIKGISFQKITGHEYFDLSFSTQNYSLALLTSGLNMHSASFFYARIISHTSMQSRSIFSFMKM